MATLSRQVSSGNDDAGETGPAFDPVLGSLPEASDGIDVTDAIQLRFNATPNGGTLIFPPSKTFWVQGSLAPYYQDWDGAANNSRRVDMIIDFNNCTLWRRYSSVSAKVHTTLDINEENTLVIDTPNLGAFDGGTSSTGFYSGKYATSQFDLRLTPAGASTPFETITATTLTDNGNGTATVAVVRRGVDPSTSNDQRSWAAGSTVTQVNRQDDAMLRMQTGDGNVWRNLKQLGPATARTPAFVSGREFQHGIKTLNTHNFTIDGWTCTHVWGDAIAIMGDRNPNIPAIDFATPSTDIHIISDGLLDSTGRHPISFTNCDRVLVEGRPGGARFRIGADSGAVTTRPVEIDLEPETNSGISNNCIMRRIQFGGRAAINSVANGRVDNFMLDDVLVGGQFGMIYGTQPDQDYERIKGITINKVVCTATQNTTGLGADPTPSNLRFTNIDDVVYTNNTIRFAQAAGVNRMYPLCLDDSTLKAASGNNITNAVNLAAVFLRERTPGSGYTRYSIGEIGNGVGPSFGTYPPAYSATAGRPFTGDFNSPVPDIAFAPNDVITFDTSGTTMAPFDGQALLTNGGDGSAGPQIFYTSQYTEARVAKSAIRCNHGGDDYRDRPASPAGDFWGDPFLDETIPLPPNPLPLGQWTAPGADWWAIVVDETRGRSYEFINARWDTGGIFHCDWGACYALNGDGVTTVTGSGSGSGSGISQLAGLLRPFELTGDGFPDHPLVFICNRNRGPRDTGDRRYPARSTDATNLNQPAYLPEGTRIVMAQTLTDNNARLGMNTWTTTQRKIAYALKIYGAYLIDQGGAPTNIAFPAQAGVGITAGPLPFDPDRMFNILGHWDGSDYKPSGSRATDEGKK